MPHRSVTRRMLLSIAGLGFVAGSVLARAQLPLTRRALTGVWRGTYAAAGVVIGGEILFQPNGTFRHTQVWNGLMTWAAGDFTIAANWVHFDIEHYGPEEYNGVRQYRPLSETWMVSAFDGRTIDAMIGNDTAVHYEKVA